METKRFVSEMNEIKEKLDQSQGLIVLSNGRSGGLALLWRRGVDVVVQTYLDYHIDAIIGSESDSQWWRFTGFYGNLDTNKKEESWLRLDRLASSSSFLLVCMGDFNELMHSKEKEGGSICPVR